MTTKKDSPWILVAEQLPEARSGVEGRPPILSDDVLVLFESRGMAVANFDHESRVWTEAKDSAREFDCDPKYWMEIPDWPEGL